MTEARKAELKKLSDDYLKGRLTPGGEFMLKTLLTEAEDDRLLAGIRRQARGSLTDGDLARLRLVRSAADWLWFKSEQGTPGGAA